MSASVLIDVAMPRNYHQIDHVTISYDPGITFMNQIDYTIATTREPVVMAPLFMPDGTTRKELNDVVAAARAASPESAVVVSLDSLMRPAVEGVFGNSMRTFVGVLTSAQTTHYNFGALLESQLERVCKDVVREGVAGPEIEYEHPLVRNRVKLYDIGYRLPTNPIDSIKVYIPGCDVGKRMSDLLRAIDGAAWTLSLMQGRHGSGPHGIDWGELGFGRADLATAQALDVYFFIFLYDLQVIKLDLRRCQDAIERWIAAIGPMADIAKDTGRSGIYSEEVDKLTIQLEACKELDAIIEAHCTVKFSADVPRDFKADALPGMIPASFESWDGMFPNLPEYTKRKWEKNGGETYDLTKLASEVVAPLLKKLPRFTSKNLLEGTYEVGGKTTPVPERLYPSQVLMAFKHFFDLKAVGAFFKHAATVLGWNVGTTIPKTDPVETHAGWGIVTNGLRFSGHPLNLIGGLAMCVPMGEAYIHDNVPVTVKMWAAEKKGVANNDTITAIPAPLTVTDPTSDEAIELSYMSPAHYMGEPNSLWAEEPYVESMEDEVLKSIFGYFVDMNKRHPKMRMDTQAVLASDDPSYRASTLVPYARGKGDALTKATLKMYEGGVDIKQSSLLRWEGTATSGATVGWARRILMRLQSRRVVYWAGAIAIAYDYPRGEMKFAKRTLTALKFSHALDDLKGVSAGMIAAFKARPDIASGKK